MPSTYLHGAFEVVSLEEHVLGKVHRPPDHRDVHDLRLGGVGVVFVWEISMGGAVFASFVPVWGASHFYGRCVWSCVCCEGGVVTLERYLKGRGTNPLITRMSMKDVWLGTYLQTTTTTTTTTRDINCCDGV